MLHTLYYVHHALPFFHILLITNSPTLFYLSSNKIRLSIGWCFRHEYWLDRILSPHGFLKWILKFWTHITEIYHKALKNITSTSLIVSNEII